MFDHSKYDKYLEEHIGNVKKAYEILVSEGVFEEDEEVQHLIDEHDKSKYEKEEYDIYIFYHARFCFISIYCECYIEL